MAAQQDAKIVPRSDGPAKTVDLEASTNSVNEDLQYCNHAPNGDAGLMDRLLDNLRIAFSMPHS